MEPRRVTHFRSKKERGKSPYGREGHGRDRRLLGPAEWTGENKKLSLTEQKVATSLLTRMEAWVQLRSSTVQFKKRGRISRQVRWPFSSRGKRDARQRKQRPKEVSS